ncbi:MAG: GNAT family N-acetyltransferase [Phycisphaerales bacterium]|nr:GNAT family N-acetyltransferase [Hyphomonadaceae bacterium]
MRIRNLTPDDLGSYRDLHRFALTEAPLAFVETPANDAARPDSVLRDLLARGEGWGAFEGERLVGKLVIDSLPYDCLAHTRWVHAVYLHPDARGSGAGASLMQTAIEHAVARGARRIALWVNERNAPARRMYERLGFVETGRVPGGIRVGDAYVDDVLMCLSVAP